MKVARTLTADETRIEEVPDPVCGPGEVVCRVLACATCGSDVQDFYVARNGCNEVTLAPTESCTMDIMMIPLAGGYREASLILTAGGASGDVTMFGTGHFAPQLIASPAAIVPADPIAETNAPTSRPCSATTSNAAAAVQWKWKR